MSCGPNYSWSVRSGSGCVPLDAAFTIHEAPVIDTDGTILRFAGDFTITCESSDGEPIHGWVRFHSDHDRPVVQPPVSYSIEVSTGTSGHVGETITLTPQVTGTDQLDAHRCRMGIESGNSLHWVRMQVAARIRPRTMRRGKYSPRRRSATIACSAASPLRRTAEIKSTEAAEESLSITSEHAPSRSRATIRCSRGQRQICCPNSTPAFGQSLTVKPPAGLDGCVLRVFGGLELGQTSQDRGVYAVDLVHGGTHPRCRRHLLRKTAPMPASSHGWARLPGPRRNPKVLPFLGAIWSETYNADIPAFAGDRWLIRQQYPGDLQRCGPRQRLLHRRSDDAPVRAGGQGNIVWDVHL